MALLQTSISVFQYWVLCHNHMYGSKGSPVHHVPITTCFRCILWINFITVGITRIITAHTSRHYSDVIMGSIASQITSLTIVYSAVYSDADQRKHQSSASLSFVRGIHRGHVNSPHKWPVTRKMFPFDDVIMAYFAEPTRHVRINKINFD